MLKLVDTDRLFERHNMRLKLIKSARTEESAIRLFNYAHNELNTYYALRLINYNSMCYMQIQINNSYNSRGNENDK